VAVPMVAARYLFTSGPYFLIIPVTGIIGHYLPVYHRFIGGRGETIMLGSMFVINWSGAILVNILSTLLGFLTFL
jgi:glycerol-3-phosphate acyltransferase PlsY